MMDIAAEIRIAITLAVIGVIVCRIGKMGDNTPRLVKLQHTVLLACLWSSIALNNTAAPIAILVGMLSFFLFSTSRWKQSDPSAKTKLTVVDAPVIDPKNWPKIVGGAD